MKKYMNTILRMAVVAAAALSFASCEGFLTRDAENQTTEEAWWYNKSILSSVVTQCYAPMPGGTLTSGAIDASLTDNSYLYYNCKVENEGLSDNGVTVANYINNTAITYGTAQSTHAHPTSVWTQRYRTIRRCSRYLENWHRAVVYPDTNPWEGIQTVDRWEAEIRALRAYYHLELFLNFGPVPIVDHVITVAEQELSRPTQQEMVKFIADEFELASRNLPVNPQVADERWRWTKGACYAYLSYLYMFVGDWANAKKWAEEVIKLNKYDIYESPTDPAHSYSEQFQYDAYTNNTKESILTKNKGLSQSAMRLAPPSVKNGTSGVSPSASLIDAYELKDGRTLDELSEADRLKYHLNPTPEDRDPRLGMTIIFPGESTMGYTWNPWVSGNTDYIGSRNSTATGYWVKKFLSPSDFTLSRTDGGSNHFMLMRYTVVLLNYVEAAIELGQIDDPNIYAYLNKIRHRAGMPDVDQDKYNTQEKLRELVRRERRVELAFEGHRLIDIRRWHIAEEVMNGPVYGAKVPEQDELYFVEERRFNPDRDYVWPIPNTEVQSNDNIEQNPGY